jgi:acyl-CoA hydrolase
MERHTIQAATVVRPFRVHEADLNGYGFMHGGRLITLCDETAYLAAMRHCGCDCLTRAIHQASFHAPLHPNDSFEIIARPALTGKSSIWVACEAIRDDSVVMDAVLVFVAVDKALQPVSVPELIAESEDERQLVQQLRAMRAAVGR